MRLLIGFLVLTLAACGGDDDDDMGAPDGGDMDAAVDAGDDASAERLLLSNELLYADFENRVIADGFIEYTPAYPLWSDGSLKRRWIRLPAGETIDTSTMNDWKFPIGTQLWKEFRAEDGTLLETRLIERTSQTKYFMGTFIWDADGTDAMLELGGAVDVNGTEHDVPRSTECLGCHAGEPGRVLGFSALQLSHEGELNLTSAGLANLFDTAPTRLYEMPGDATAKAAFGAVHANCGHCHTPTGTAGMQFPDGQEMWLDILVEEVDGPVTATRLYTTTVGVANAKFLTGVSTKRVSPGNVTDSSLSERQKSRGMDGMPNSTQMPPLATEVVNMSAVQALDDWILSLAE